MISAGLRTTTTLFASPCFVKSNPTGPLYRQRFPTCSKIGNWHIQFRSTYLVYLLAPDPLHFHRRNLLHEFSFFRTYCRLRSAIRKYYCPQLMRCPHPASTARNPEVCAEWRPLCARTSLRVVPCRCLLRGIAAPERVTCAQERGSAKQSPVRLRRALKSRRACTIRRP